MSKKNRFRSHKRVKTPLPPPAPLQEVETCTEELKQHYTVEEGVKDSITRVLNHPLDYYLSRDEITQDQYNSGCALYNDYQISHKNTTTLALLGAGRGVDAYLSNINNPHTAFERYMRALKSLNPISKSLAEQICIMGYAMAEIRGTFPWRKHNNGMDRLREMLDDLTIFYMDERKERNLYNERQREIEADELRIV